MRIGRPHPSSQRGGVWCVWEREEASLIVLRETGPSRRLSREENVGAKNS